MAPVHRRPGAAGGAAAALTGDDEARRRATGEQVLRAQPVGARPARAVPRRAAAVRGVPRPAAAAAPALLLDLLVAAGQPARSAASPPGCCAARPARADGRVRRRLLRATWPTQPANEHGVRRSSGSPTIPFRPPGEPARADDHGRGRAPGWRRSAGSCRNAPRSRQRAVPVAPSLLFFGCRNPDADLLYADELREFEQSAASSGWRPRSRASPGKPAGTCRTRCSDAPTRSGTCCSRAPTSSSAATPRTIAPGVRAALPRIFRDHTGGDGRRRRRPGWPGCATDHRYLEDIWGG